MADGDSGGTGGEDDREESVRDRFELGDTVGEPDADADATSGDADDGPTARSGEDTAPEDTDSAAAPEEDGPRILTPRERAAAGADRDQDTEAAGPGAAADATDETAASPFDGDAPAFEEVQRFRQRWLWTAVLGVSLLSVVTWAFNSTGPLLTVLLLGVPAVGTLGTYVARLETTVREDGVHVRLFPLHRRARVVQFRDVTGVQRREYDAFGDFGGIGIRRTHDAWAYITGSGPGVVLERADRLDVVVGTDRPVELERAAERGLARSRGAEGGLEERWRAVANFDASDRIDA
jgi:hypothetical protein